MNINKYITTDPQICHGKPCFKGTRIMIYIVLEMLAAGETPADIFKNAYPKLTPKHIEAVLKYAAQMAQEGHLVKIPQSHALSSR